MLSQWTLVVSDSAAVDDIVSSTSLPRPLARILVSRGILGSAASTAFLQPDISQLHDPFTMHGIKEAAHRIARAIRLREPILIYGDYDVDGTTATVILKAAIDRLTPGSDSLVRYHIPHRIREGYGMQTSVLGEAVASGVRLVISVDTGIRAFAAAEEAKALAVDLIITDHHLPDGLEIPSAIAVINPKQPACNYPFKELCGAGIAFKLAHALLVNESSRETTPIITLEAINQKLIPSLLKLLAIATVADSVPLIDENRTIVALGLQQLRQPAQTGLRTLMQLAKVGVDPNQPITATDLAFRIAPRINAAGRMDIASDVVELFLSQDKTHAAGLAEKLHRLNEERRIAEQEVLATVDAELDRLRDLNPNLVDHGCLVLSGEGWHRGVIGILASRVVERTGLPALVIATEDGLAHGSGRSIEGFHLLDALTHAHAAEAPLFHRFGGHAHAVGFSLSSCDLPRLRTLLTSYTNLRLTPSLLNPSLSCDAELNFSEITASFCNSLRQLEPFGNGNREPLFLARNARITEVPRLLKEKHLRLHLQQNDGSAMACLCWSRTTDWPAHLQQLGLEQGSVVDVAFRVRENRHPSFGGPEIELHALRPFTGA